MAKLQLALDGNLRDGLAILKQVNEFVDIVEIGTPLVFREGIHAIQIVAARYPQLEILADFKIMDAGEEEASIAFAAGADYVTVLGVAHDSTIEGVVQAAHSFERRVVVDMMRVPEPLKRTRELIDIGCDYICFHTAFDVQGKVNNTLPQLVANIQAQITELPLAVAGGIKPQTIDTILPLKPRIVVVGGGITRADDPVVAAKALKEAMG